MMPCASVKADARQRKQRRAEPSAAGDWSCEEAFYCFCFLDSCIHRVSVRVSHRTGGLCTRTFRLTELCSRTIQFSLLTLTGGIGFDGDQLDAAFRSTGLAIFELHVLHIWFLHFRNLSSDAALNFGANRIRQVIWPLDECCTALDRLENRRAKNPFRIPSAVVFSLRAWPFWL
jgi:hypothetical protein